MNVEIGAEAALFPEKEHINGIGGVGVTDLAGGYGLVPEQGRVGLGAGQGRLDLQRDELHALLNEGLQLQQPHNSQNVVVTESQHAVILNKDNQNIKAKAEQSIHAAHGLNNYKDTKP